MACRVRVTWCRVSSATHCNERQRVRALRKGYSVNGRCVWTKWGSGGWGQGRGGGNEGREYGLRKLHGKIKRTMIGWHTLKDPTY